MVLIPARGGSKGLPGKNIKLMNGKPLIAYAIEAAKQCKLVDKIIVTTDNKEIADVAISYGAEVPFFLPEEYTTDTAPMEPTLKYTVEWIEKNQNFPVDIMIYFQLTDFFKQPKWIDECIQVLIDNPEVDSCFVGCKEHKNFWKREGDKHIKLTNPVYGPRQKREPIFREDTGLGAATRGSVVKGGRRLGDNVVLLEKDYPFFDIHTDFDFFILESATKQFPEINSFYKDFKRDLKLDDCKLCKLSDEKDHTYLKEYNYWHLRTTPIQHTLGAHVISLKRHAERFSELRPEELAEYISIQKDIERALKNTFKPDRINYIQLGNVINHVHVHLIPRYASNKEFAGQTWQDKMFVETPGLAPVMKQTPDSQETILKIKEEMIKHLQ